MFEPQPGYNGHPAFVSTVHFALPLSDEDASTHCSIFLDAENLFVLRTHQYRTFDLIDKPWSRFLPIRIKGEAAVPGVNILTRKVRFSPYSQVDILVGGRIRGEYVSCEIAFGAWGHYKGRVKFADDWQEIYGIAGTTSVTSASGSTILTKAANDAEFVAIRESDLDVESALSPGQVIFKTHAALNVHYKESSFATLGWQMQIPYNNTNGFTTWSLWVSAGGSF